MAEAKVLPIMDNEITEKAAALLKDLEPLMKKHGIDCNLDSIKYGVTYLPDGTYRRTGSLKLTADVPGQVMS